MRLKMLSGAPLRENLDFSPDALLSEDAVAKVLYGFTLESSIENSTASHLKWRGLAPRDAQLRTGWSQPYLPRGALRGNDPDLSFSVLNMEGVSELPPDDITTMDTTYLSEMECFAQHSLIFHETLVSSQIAADGAADRTVSSSSFLKSSFGSTGSALDSPSLTNSQAPVLQVPSTLILTSLSSLPSANRLRSIYPQTPTPNILCVLTAPPEDKEVFVKKGGYRMNLREIVVADDTSSGFKVSFWSRPGKKDDPQNRLKDTLSRIKVGDILLLRNIALNAFRDNVYGQSLHLSIVRVRTQVEVLMNGGGISSRQLGALPSTVVTAFMKVKRWAKKHVVPEMAGSKKRQQLGLSSRAAKRSRLDDTLPPDTMESI
ncbi:hypothetical protein CC80DRAFT_176778 [Byssothecium circinans]|uniref:Nucleic acid-binding protein n=1 Tax=Byssothecium circinans TaxID=147558 RepID=A0A6A5TP38_9PLEO|nr:hypothetical protein CC80DRAFT_176778 [Byssothecium circinans]